LTNIHGGNDYDFAHNIIMDVPRGNSSPIFPDSNEAETEVSVDDCPPPEL
jgi:hypothetical protein